MKMVHYLVLIFATFLFGSLRICNAAAIDSNAIFKEEPRISSNDELFTTILDNCFIENGIHCIKEKLLGYLDYMNGISIEDGRSFSNNNIDKMIFERTARLLNTNVFRIELPQTFFHRTALTYRADRGLDFELPQEQARGDMKKKLLLPILLLLKLKVKAVLPILIGIVGLKAMKALILSKLAIKLVLGFLIYNLIQKLGGMKMTMAPMMAAPEPIYGAPPSTPASTYGEPNWEANSSPYSRWDASNSGQNLAYNSYYPNSGSSSTSGSSSSSSSSPSSSSYSSYSS